MWWDTTRVRSKQHDATKSSRPDWLVQLIATMRFRSAFSRKATASDSLGRESQVPVFLWNTSRHATTGNCGNVSIGIETGFDFRNFCSVEDPSGLGGRPAIG